MSDGTKACSRNSKGLDHRIYWGRGAERGWLQLVRLDGSWIWFVKGLMQYTCRGVFILFCVRKLSIEDWGGAESICSKVSSMEVL